MDYLKDRSPQATRRVRDRIRLVESLLAEFPHAGSPTRLDWPPRMTTAPYPYLIFYEVSGDEVIVHAVRHGAMRPSSMPDADDV